jgi:hypothetical protein
VPRTAELEPVISPAQVLREVVDSFAGPEVPDPITFVIGEQWLNQPNLYPRQATLLKVIFLRDDLFTAYDRAVIDGWIQDFLDSNPEGQEGEKFSESTNGIQPDIYERIAWLKARGYRWFKEVILAIGRRGSKGYVCALAMAYVIWNYMATGNPQEHYGIQQSKQLACAIFAGKRDQAKENLWGDLYGVITEAPCFSRYLSLTLAEILTVYAPYDFVRLQKLANRGIKSTKDIASIRIIPRESVPLAARGPAGCILGFDEAAHVTSTGVTRAFGDVYSSATPSLGQFGRDGFICLPSSTWEMIGKFYELWDLSLQTEENADGGRVPIYANKLMLQLSSWAIYLDWEKAHELELFPADFTGDLDEYAPWNEDSIELPRLQPLKGAIESYDEELRLEERANPDTFNVERRSYWQTALDAYLNKGRVSQMFAPWDERLPEYGRPLLEMQSGGPLIMSYRAHGDPSTVNNRFGFALAHQEPGPDGMNHCVFDLIKYWDPADFEGHIIDYDIVIDWIFENIVMPFQPEEVTFDQFNSVASVQRLQKMVRHGRFQKNITVYERTATAPLNWKTYETFKTALNMGFVHAPHHEEGIQELKFLQKPEGQQKVVCPDSGPVITKDIADCIAIVTYELLGEQMNAFLRSDLRNQRPGLAMGHDTMDPYRRFDPHEQNPYASQLGQGALSRGVRPAPPGMRPPVMPRRAGGASLRRHRS